MKTGSGTSLLLRSKLKRELARNTTKGRKAEQQTFLRLREPDLVGASLRRRFQLLGARPHREEIPGFGGQKLG